MSEIFISHAVADAPLAKQLTNFLKEGIGVPQDAIFCSSVPGHGIPLSEDFNAYIKDQIQTPKLVILLMTPAYMESWFCLMELGAAWAKSIDSLAIVVPPVAFSSVTATLGTKQAWNISNHKGLVDFRAKIRSAVTTLEKRTDHVWEEKRDQWMSDLKVALQALKPAQKVDATIHEDALARIENQAEELAALERAKAALEAELAAVKKLKDPDAVRAHERTSVGMKGAQAEFDELIEAVNDARPAHISTVVFHHLLMDHFDKSSRIDWYSNDADDFRTAIKYAIIDDEDERVMWGRDKLKPLKKAIEAVSEFLETEEGCALARANPGRNWDADDLEFWEDHL